MNGGSKFLAFVAIFEMEVFSSYGRLSSNLLVDASFKKVFWIQGLPPRLKLRLSISLSLGSQSVVCLYLNISEYIFLDILHRVIATERYKSDRAQFLKDI